MQKLLFFIVAVCLLSPASVWAADATAFNPEDATSFNPVPIAIDALQAGVPIGTIITYATSTPPDGFLPCNGQTFSSTKYPKLAAVLGRNQVPDMRGMFVRGYDPAGVNDANGAGRSFASAQGDAIRNITGEFGGGNRSFHNASARVAFGGTSGAFTVGDYGRYRDLGSESGWNMYGKVMLDASRLVPTANENRPKNINLLYAIKHD